MVLYEVPVDPEKGKRRQFIDAVAVGMWPSTTHVVHGFEIKATRADLRKELSSPTKAEAAMRECDFFWLVVPSLDLIKPKRGEDLMPKIPEAWGILRAQNETLYQYRPATGMPGPMIGRRLFTACLSKAANSVIDTLDLVPAGTAYQQKRNRRSRRRAA